ncbi:MAG TPA: NUDIX hydrolase [Bradyrhizobium sp.]|uniref:NUDIX hydrolase n=1 Tax=Bradyrhizobium sp. TaxID=376 RepID=UPI002D7E2777|nr:NUDIX hydrolase [Bradyrhizobium sp.]HET7888267.1 NUDIX hydrolase [Bradyrhizobium sp.]
MTSPEIHRIATLELKVKPFAWPFAQARREEIDAHFAEKRRDRPGIWNGRVLLGRNAVRSGDHLSAEFFETDFASFLAWRDWGFPDTGVFNGFGMGAVRSSDGAFLLGEMGGHTANAGRIYFPAGTPDPDDIRDGAVDIAGSVARELAEETGLGESDYTKDGYWTCVFTGASIAMIRILRVALSGAALQAKIEAYLARESQPELRAVHLVRGSSDLVPAMPVFVSAFLAAQF